MAHESKTMNETVIWSVSNRASREIVCRLVPDEAGALVLSLLLEGETILAEAHFSKAQALERASSLRNLLANWEQTT